MVGSARAGGGGPLPRALAARGEALPPVVLALGGPRGRRTGQHLARQQPQDVRLSALEANAACASAMALTCLLLRITVRKGYGALLQLLGTHLSC